MRGTLKTGGFTSLRPASENRGRRRRRPLGATPSRHTLAALLLPALATLPFAAPDLSPAHASPRSAPQREVDPDGYTSARICGDCHRDIYDTWKNSLHAYSLTDPIFDTAYMEAIRDAGDEAKRICLSCHAPMTLVNGDYDLEMGVTREGVSCDFCHTVTAVHLDDPAKPYSVQLGRVKRSVLKESSSPAHDVAYSELHERSEFCGGCHDYTAPNGTPLMSTYQEWKDGPYAKEGVQCQSCHMALSAGRVARKDLASKASEFHLHSLIHDTAQVRSALTVRIVSTERSDRNLVALVEIENVGSGHKIPTGIPTREVVLTVSIEGTSRDQSREIRYRKVIGDERYRPLTRDAQVLLFGASVLSDNRIAPREKRLERIVFRPPGAGTAKVVARLTYLYNPLVIKPERVEIRLGESERVVY